MLIDGIVAGATIPAVTEVFREMLAVMQMHPFLGGSMLTPVALLPRRSCFDSCAGDIPGQVVSSPASAREYFTVLHSLHDVYFKTRVFLVTKV